MIKRPKNIILHHMGGAYNPSWDIKKIDEMHKKRYFQAGITPLNNLIYCGYNAVISRYGIQTGRKIGSKCQASHGYQYDINILLMGNGEMEMSELEDLPTFENTDLYFYKGLLVSYLKQLQKTFDILNSNILGHYETYQKRSKKVEKTCPGFDMEMFRNVTLKTRKW